MASGSSRKSIGWRTEHFHRFGTVMSGTLKPKFHQQEHVIDAIWLKYRIRDHGRYCLHHDLDDEQIQGALLDGVGVCDLFKLHRIIGGSFEFHGTHGNGGKTREQGVEAVNRQTIVGLFGSCLPLESFGALNRWSAIEGGKRLESHGSLPRT